MAELNELFEMATKHMNPTPEFLALGRSVVRYRLYRWLGTHTDHDAPEQMTVLVPRRKQECR